MFKSSINTGESSPSGVSNEKSSFIKNVDEARQKRQLEKKKQQSALLIQSVYRGYITRKKESTLIDTELNLSFQGANKSLAASQTYILLKKYFLYDRLVRQEKSNQMLIQILKCLTYQIQTVSEFKTTYVSLIISKTNYQNFIQQSNKLVDKCVLKMQQLNLKDKEHVKQIEIYINFLMCLTNYKLWKCFTQLQQPAVEQLLKETTRSYSVKLSVLYELFHKLLNQNLQQHNLMLNKLTMSSILNLAIQTLKAHNYQANVLMAFSSSILTIPAVVLSCHSMSALKNELDCDLSCRLYALFSDSTTDSLTNKFLNEKDLVQAVSFLGNLCSLSEFYDSNFQFNLDNFIIISNKILDYCTKLSTSNNKSNDHVRIFYYCYIDYLLVLDQIFYNIYQ